MKPNLINLNKFFLLLKESINIIIVRFIIIIYKFKVKYKERSINWLVW